MYIDYATPLGVFAPAIIGIPIIFRGRISLAQLMILAGSDYISQPVPAIHHTEVLIELL